MSKPARPKLKFATIDDMVADADRLRGGYTKTGEWDLGMILDHLTKWISLPFQSDRRSLPWPIPPIARFVLHRMSLRESYPTIKFPAPSPIRPTPGITLEAAYPAFTSACGRAASLAGDAIELPPIGRVPRADFLRMLLLHAAHHLSFLRPV